MKIDTAIHGLRLHALLLAHAIVAAAYAFVEKVRDRLNGDVDSALAGFAKAEKRLDRARMVAIRTANSLDAQAERLQQQLEATDDAYDAQIAVAERAARVQQRLAKLLD